MDEDIGFKNGTEMPVFDIEFGKIALMTCYDIRFVELSRTYALRGAETIIVVSNSPRPKVNHWRVLLQARAIENQLFIVACNRRVGSALNSSYFGHSLIIDPWGEIIAEGDEDDKDSRSAGYLYQKEDLACLRVN
jgi:predicted amidohydrolase